MHDCPVLPSGAVLSVPLGAQANGNMLIPKLLCFVPMWMPKSRVCVLRALVLKVPPWTELISALQVGFQPTERVLSLTGSSFPLQVTSVTLPTLL